MAGEQRLPTQRRALLERAFQWDPNAKGYSAEAHDKPAPPLLAPCVTWGFSIRPYAGDDPIAAESEREQRLRRNVWTGRINWILRLFEHEAFRPAGAVGTEFFDVVDPDETGVSRFRVASKNFRIRWRGLAGSVLLEQAEEYTSFLFTLSLQERDAPRMVGGLDPAPPRLPIAAAAAADTLPALMVNAFKTLLRADESLSPGGDQDRRSTLARLSRQVDPAAELLINDVWDQFLSDLLGVSAQYADDAGLRPSRPARCRIDPPEDEDPLFPGRVFAAQKGVVGREDEGWLNPDDPRTPHSAYSEKEAFETLEKRRAVLQAFFPKGRNREFVGSLTAGRQAIFVSTLGSTHYDSALEHDFFGARERSNFVEPSRYFVLFKNRPDAPQLGRLVERLNALETLRLASVLEIEKLRDVGAALRHLGARLDAITKDQDADDHLALEEIMQGIAAQGGALRGGVSHRIGRATVYSEAYLRRLAELREEWLETWQSYGEFVKRRLQESFDLVQEVREQRETLFARVQILLQLHSGGELVALQRETEQNLKSTDLISYVAAIVGFIAVGAQMSGAIAEVFPPEARDWVTPAAVVSIEGREQWLGGVGGLFCGVLAGLLIFVFRQISRRSP